MTNCKTNNNMNHQVVRFLKEKLNLTNFLEVKSSSIVKGKTPHAWQRLTNGRNCSKTDMAVNSISAIIEKKTWENVVALYNFLKELSILIGSHHHGNF